MSEDTWDLTRRKLMQGSGAATAAGLAGCIRNSADERSSSSSFNATEKFRDEYGPENGSNVTQLEMAYLNKGFENTDISESQAELIYNSSDELGGLPGYGELENRFINGSQLDERFVDGEALNETLIERELSRAGQNYDGNVEQDLRELTNWYNENIIEKESAVSDTGNKTASDTSVQNLSVGNHSDYEDLRNISFLNSTTTNRTNNRTGNLTNSTNPPSDLGSSGFEVPHISYKDLISLYAETRKADVSNEFIEGLKTEHDVQIVRQTVAATELGQNYEETNEADKTTEDFMQQAFADEDRKISPFELEYLAFETEEESLPEDPYSNDWSEDKVENIAAFKMFEDPLEKQELYAQNEKLHGIRWDKGKLKYRVETENGIQTSNISMESWREYRSSYHEMVEELQNEDINIYVFGDKEEKDQALVNMNHAFMTSLGSLKQFEEEGEPFNRINETTRTVTQSQYSLKRGSTLAENTNLFKTKGKTGELISGLEYVTKHDFINSDDVEEAVERMKGGYNRNFDVEQTVEDVRDTGSGDGGDGSDGPDFGGGPG